MHSTESETIRRDFILFSNINLCAKKWYANEIGEESMNAIPRLDSWNGNSGEWSPHLLHTTCEIPNKYSTRSKIEVDSTETERTETAINANQSANLN